ncbi:Heavy metal transport/detoxification superfamily protein [Rhynchospora pubera]|uniref:Heavy metal transport/detoxification superfamily protein n=1 Tax=Rhynchospora pubera TaxID=906938 RepID=A0AAV8DW13_9POAL|nr:Heavy metal transport/detoxification superfamily protein [Rhynchospora pubera]KAJ4781603.1 Heavy metal transport/detoxification superfamily protein [Rhynchospora pubera]KAJ4808033.1 Heavy metal transport/detoxification superfamily protein [Rhynchospora pubera]
MKKIVVKVIIVHEKKKTVILGSVAKLDGIQSLNLDEGTLTVIGNVDPVSIISSLKKKKIAAQIESIGPPEEKKPDEKKPDEEKDECEKACEKMIECCRRPCSGMPFGWYPHRPVIWYEEPQYECIIS